jgi:hypothetical protein
MGGMPAPFGLSFQRMGWQRDTVFCVYQLAL